MAQPPLLVTSFLLLAIPVCGAGVLLPVLFPIIRVAGAPFARAIPAHLTVLGIGGDLLFVIVGAALSLTIRFAAGRLKWLELGRLETFLTIAAKPFTHTGVVALTTLVAAADSQDVETVGESLPRPRQWTRSQISYKIAKIAVVLFRY